MAKGTAAQSIKIIPLILLILALCMLAGCLNDHSVQGKNSTLSGTGVGTTSPLSPAPVTTASSEESHVVYYGVYQPTSPGLSVFEQDARKNVAIVSEFQQWGDTGGKADFDTENMEQIREYGSIPMITWEPRDASQGLDQPDYSLDKIINGNYDSYITSYALAAKAWGHPFFLRFGHEMNGNWYPWSEDVNGNTKGEFVLAWRHVHDIFTKNNVTNVLWVWCPSRLDLSPYGLRELYPGDDYVDWVGMDGYNQPDTKLQAGHWQSFSEVFSDLYDKTGEITVKPVMIAEFATVEGNEGQKAEWIYDALSDQIPHHFTRVYAAVWFNAKFEGPDPVDWRIETSPTAQESFASAISSPLYASNTYSSATMSDLIKRVTA